MPLYTYVVTYQGATHVAQGSHSNHQGFMSTWVDQLPTLTVALRKELASKAYAPFSPIANMQHAWRKSIELDGSACTVVVVQTQR